MPAKKDTSEKGQSRSVIPGTITFSGGSPGGSGDPYCFPFNSRGIAISFALGSVTMTLGCVTTASVYFIENGGTLTLKYGPSSFTSFTIPASAVPDPTKCNQYVLVITKQCMNTQTRVVAQEEFRICPTCP